MNLRLFIAAVIMLAASLLAAKPQGVSRVQKESHIAAELGVTLAETRDILAPLNGRDFDYLGDEYDHIIVRSNGAIVTLDCSARRK